MAYTTNPNLPEVRMEAVRKVAYKGWSTRKAALHFGYDHSTIVRWLSRKPVYGRHGRVVIPTRSCRPFHHPAELSTETVGRILALRRERSQCAEILRHRLSTEDIFVSLSSVKRVLKRHGCTRFSPWKKWHQYPPRPLPQKPGVLVQVDTVWQGKPELRVYVYTLLDVCSRWALAWATSKINTFKSTSLLGPEEI
jgi:transposase